MFMYSIQILSCYICTCNIYTLKNIFRIFINNKMGEYFILNFSIRLN